MKEKKYHQSLIFVTNEFDPELFENSIMAAFLNEGDSYDFKYIYPEKTLSISVDQIRKVSEDIYKKDILDKVRVYVFVGIDDVGGVGQNALLKNLEEPPTGIFFVLVCKDIKPLLATIVSRCRVEYDKENYVNNTDWREEELLLLTKKDSTGKLNLKNKTLTNSVLESQILAQKMENTLSQDRLSKLILFNMWIRK